MADTYFADTTLADRYGIASNNSAQLFRGGSMTSLLNKYMPDAYKRVARTVGYSLHLADADAWHGLTVVLTARLTPRERAAMAWAVLRSLTPDQVVAVAETVLPHGTGAPIAPLFNHMDEAAFWADMAEPDALEAYCLARATQVGFP